MKFGIFITFGIISSNYFVNILVILPQITQYCDFRLRSDHGTPMDILVKKHNIVLFEVKSQEYGQHNC